MSSASPRSVSAQDLVSHVRRRVQLRDRLVARLAVLPTRSPRRAETAARLVDVLADLAEIRALVRVETTARGEQAAV